MNKNNFYFLFRFRWSIPIIAEIYNQDGSRFVTLIQRLNISRSVLTYTIDKLINDGLINRNPGYGHPLRPEYVLTDLGHKIAPFCQELIICVRKHNAQRLLQSRWSFRILFLPIREGVRFSVLISLLAPITPRALSEELKLLINEGFIRRKIIDDYPPKAIYELSSKSQPFITVLEKYKKDL
ncbi:MAG: helix-turn-helix transcriptional regulator [Candidatus Aminicenantes bacterium]|nr:helix-turn-helix transcriptional regulator [Candidatus Aminicenantes bacterium]